MKRAVFQFSPSAFAVVAVTSYFCSDYLTHLAHRLIYVAAPFDRSG
jgi:hypothetical protein